MGATAEKPRPRPYRQLFVQKRSSQRRDTGDFETPAEGEKWGRWSVVVVHEKNWLSIFNPVGRKTDWVWPQAASGCPPQASIAQPHASKFPLSLCLKYVCRLCAVRRWIQLHLFFTKKKGRKCVEERQSGALNVLQKVSLSRRRSNSLFIWARRNHSSPVKKIEKEKKEKKCWE